MEFGDLGGSVEMIDETFPDWTPMMPLLAGAPSDMMTPALDLRDVAPGPGETVNVNASVGIGRLQVNVPSSARIEVDAHTGAGSILLFGRHDDGWHRDVIRSVDGDPGARGGVLHLKLRVGAGEVDVHRFQPGGIETLIGVSG